MAGNHETPDTGGVVYSGSGPDDRDPKKLDEAMKDVVGYLTDPRRDLAAMLDPQLRGTDSVDDAALAEAQAKVAEQTRPNDPEQPQ